MCHEKVIADLTDEKLREIMEAHTTEEIDYFGAADDIMAAICGGVGPFTAHEKHCASFRKLPCTCIYGEYQTPEQYWNRRHTAQKETQALQEAQQVCKCASLNGQGICNACADMLRRQMNRWKDMYNEAFLGYVPMTPGDFAATGASATPAPSERDPHKIASKYFGTKGGLAKQLAEEIEYAVMQEHQSHVSFENELYATLVDPLADGAIKESNMRARLLESARWYRQRVEDLENQLNTLRAGTP